MKITRTSLRKIDYRIVDDRCLEWKIQTVKLQNKESGKRSEWTTFVLNNDVRDFEKSKDPYFGAQFYENGNLKFFGVIVDGICKAGLYLHFESDQGLFKTGMSGTVYDKGVLKLLSAWHDKDEPQEKTRESLEVWARGKIVSIIELRNRIQQEQP